MSRLYQEKEYHDKFDKNLFKQLLDFFSKIKKYLILLMIITLIVVVIDGIFPLLNKYVLDNFLNTATPITTILLFAIIYFSMVIFQSILFYYEFKVTGHIESKLGANMRKAAFENLMHLSFRYFDATASGWTIARLTSDIVRIAEVVAWTLFDSSWAVIQIIIISAIMLIINWQLALVVLIVVPVFFIVTYYFQKAILDLYRKTRLYNSKLTSHYNEAINGIKTTKTLTLETKNYQEFILDSAKMRKVAIITGKYQAFYRPLVNLASGISLASIIYLGIILVFKQNLSFSVLVLFSQYSVQFFEPLRMLTNAISEIQLAKASMERVFGMINEKSDNVDRPEVIEKYGDLLASKKNISERIIGAVEYRNVDFYYQASEPILTNFNLKVKPKETIALVGKTGGGKSTIINLLSRFYEPVSGNILIDGQDYREHSISWLHSQIGYILQTPHLFSGSIMENIRYGNKDATDEEIIEICKQIHAHDFIKDLEGQYNFEVGEMGNLLSLGQKQLISFARALIRKPSIMILDEATSSIDTQTEYLIQKAIDKIMASTTTFVVAHRLSTITNADRILVIYDGKIVQEGNHQELVKQKGYYRDLYLGQFMEESMHNINL